MSFSDSSSSPLGPLNPGDVVSAALRLYRDRFKTYLQLSALATLWIFGGFLGLALVVALLAGGLGAMGGETLALLGGLLGAALGLLPLFYGVAKYTMISSVIGRLAFRDLINQPETSLEARRALNPKLGQFLLLGFLLALVFFATYLVAALVATLVGVGSGLVVGGILGALTNSTVGGIVGSILGIMLGLSIFLLGLIWVVSHLFIPDVVLAVEPSQDAGSSLGRSWDLTQKSIGRIQIVFLATFLIQVPVLFVTNSLPSILLAFVPESLTAMVISQGIGFILSLAGSMVILPLWQAVKGVLYYDLRSRREGLDLELR
ncbi:MAG: hypothetical protein VKI82_08300 [Leptolyngbya sp.]|nr:hypothetical protein [Leptolyngbya sp.]